MTAPSSDQPGLPPRDPQVDRRRFFRFGLKRLLQGVSESVESVQSALGTAAAAAGATGGEPLSPPPTSAAAGPGRSLVPPGVYLRPPGALPEKAYLNTCTACSECVRVCPTDCIRVDLTGAKGHGKAYIDADTAACSVCEDLACTTACPSGALLPVPLSRVRMGTAVWREETCIRTGGEECRICVEKCPIGTSAIDIAGAQVIVNPVHCVGCGMCQHYCPTSPKSVVVIPVAARG